MSSPPSSTIEERGQRSSFIARDVVDMVPVGWDTISWLECGNFHTRPFHQSWSHEYGNNGESFYQRRRSNFLWFSPRSIRRRCCPSSDSIFKNGFPNQVGLYLRKERILRRPPLVCEGGLYGGRCPPLVRRCPSVRTPHLLTTTMGFLFAQ